MLLYLVVGAAAAAGQIREGLSQPNPGPKLPLPTPPSPGAALSADGSLALVGGSDDAAYVFVRNGGVWSQEARLTGSDAGAGSVFGSAISLTPDGSRALVGASHGPAAFCPYTPSICGAAYVFVRNGGVWTEEAKLELGDDPGLLSFGGVAFGLAVSLSNDGATALVSAPFECATGEDCGLVAVFRRSGSTWTLEQKIQPGDPANFASFGISAVLSGDGQTALIGTVPGAAYVFTFNGTVWSQQTKLTNPGGGLFRGSPALALSDDGNRAAVSSDASCASGISCGAVSLFSRSGGTWTFDQKVVPAGVTAGDNFGVRIAMSGDGTVLLASSPGDSCDAGLDRGKLYLFMRPPGGSFTERLGFRASDTTASDLLGVWIALSDDGSTALAQTHPCGSFACGVVYAFAIADLALIDMPTLSEAGLLLLALALAAAGALALRRRTA